MQFDYYHGTEAEQFSFFRIPKVLVTGSEFKGISVEAKLLYGLMLDRMGLSMKNGWLDEQNRVYIIYRLEEVMECLSCADQKATKHLRELESIGLIERKRQGLGRPDIIYVKNFIGINDSNLTKEEGSESRFKNRENHDSAVGKFTTQESGKSRSNKNNNNNKTELKDTETDIARADTADAVVGQLKAEFDKFMAAYPPVPFNAAEAWREYKRICPPIEELMRALDAWKRSSQWKEEEGRYIPSPNNFLKKSYFKNAPGLVGTLDNEPSAPLPSTVCKRSASSAQQAPP